MNFTQLWLPSPEKVVEAEAFATGRPLERVRSARSRADLVSSYLHARGEAGELWAEIQSDGCAGSAQDHPAYYAFQAAQERRHSAVRLLAADPVAVAAMRDAGILDPLEVAADHLMATGVKRRSEAFEWAKEHAAALGLIEPLQPQLQPGMEWYQGAPDRDDENEDDENENEYGDDDFDYDVGPSM